MPPRSQYHPSSWSTFVYSFTLLLLLLISSDSITFSFLSAATTASSSSLISRLLLLLHPLSPVAVSWGYARFVNIRDGRGATPLHLTARRKQPECVHILLYNGALVCASSGRYGFPGSTPLHLVARGGSLDCICMLLAWGADRLQRDASGSSKWPKHYNSLA
ncbi:putative E3 ubiquitin-protein ligase XBAT31 [Gossypium hirsutum]|uniref:E3 ubiquitin-protein ligase XBAT31 n=1 Tax=Gossypium hirsutum TaxID=3635 RepID=A0ABM2ZXQ3_GOSHI|nr:putative E3 ubiquitin-protein ligase XBAT31 [Gossypium hirsutum]